MSAETDEILRIFGEMLSIPTGDGKNKRDAGTKVHWTIDPGHKDAMLRHLGRWWNGEKADADSGAHPLVHLAWRALAVAYQETHTEVPGQDAFWQDILDVGIVKPQQGAAVYFNHDPRPMPRTIDRAPCATKRNAGEPWDVV